MKCRPLLLDLFAGAGGAAVGYHRAGFGVVGVDSAPQPRYPFPLIRADAMRFLELLLCGCWSGDRDRAVLLGNVAAIHASPPCQRYSQGTKRWKGRAETHPDLVGKTRDLLEQTKKPWVIENVPGSPLRNPLLLCGKMFGLRVYRHRLFESNKMLFAPSHLKHRESTGSHRGYSYRHPFVCVAGHNFNLAEAQAAMGIDWMKVCRELAQAVPPAYTEYLGRQLVERLTD